MKWILGLVLLAGAATGVVLAGGVDPSVDRAITWVRGALDAAPPAPAPVPAQADPATAARQAAVTTPATAPQPAARIERRPDGKPGEELSEADRARLARIIDERLGS